MQCESCRSTIHSADSFCRVCGAPSADGPFSRRALLFLALAGTSFSGAMSLGASLCSHLGLLAAETNVYFAFAIAGATVAWFAIRSLLRMENRPRRIAPPSPPATTKRDIDTEVITKRLD